MTRRRPTSYWDVLNAYCNVLRRSAKAIEAHRAETTKIGSVHESAVPKGFAQ